MDAELIEDADNSLKNSGSLVFSFTVPLFSPVQNTGASCHPLLKTPVFGGTEGIDSMSAIR